MKNKSNKTKYALLTPVYDIAFGPLFKKARKRAISLVPIKDNEEVLVIGVGTGQDLKYINNNAKITGIDLSTTMLQKARRKRYKCDVALLEMNAENLRFEDHKYDVVVMNLVLSVVEQPKIALKEALRVLKEDGTILIFDKFKKNNKLSLKRRALNIVTSTLGTDITRSFESIVGGFEVEVYKDVELMFKGNYRGVLLRKMINTDIN